MKSLVDMFLKLFNIHKPFVYSLSISNLFFLQFKHLYIGEAQAILS